jgi:hypothetical protein
MRAGWSQIGHTYQIPTFLRLKRLLTAASYESGESMSLVI